jgi:hypothetical protein
MSGCGLPETDSEVQQALEIVFRARTEATAILKRANREIAALQELCSHPRLTEPKAYGWRDCAVCEKCSIKRDET